MSEQTTTGATSVEKVTWLFENTGYDVSQAVGEEPGTVDYFATARTGVVRPRTYWKVWEMCPSALETALEELERERRRHQADRALGIVMQGGLPAGYRVDFTGRATNLITVRRLALELSGVADEVRDFVEDYESRWGPQHYVPRRGRLQNGEVVALEQHIESWVRTGKQQTLLITGSPGVGKRTAIRHAMYQAGTAFQSDIDNATPLIWIGETDPARDDVLYQHWAIAVRMGQGLTTEHEALYRRVITSIHPIASSGSESSTVEIEVLPPDAIEVDNWFRRGLPQEVAERFSMAINRVPPFRDLALAPARFSALRDAINSTPASQSNLLSEWIARVVAAYTESELDKQATSELVISHIEQFALRQFALDQGFTWSEVSKNYLARERLGRSSWFVAKDAHSLTSHKDDTLYFSNVLIRDYFVARRIAAEVLAGRSEILTRYHFPQEYVLLFLAVISPEVAARATADRTEELRASVESEVERRLQLTLAHLLKRSAGSVRSHLKTIKKRLSAQDAITLQYELTRIEQELTFQSALAEQTRLLHEVPEMVIAALSVEDVIEPIVHQQRENHPRVQCEVQVPMGLRVRASLDGLREVLSCLLENAFQAAAFTDGQTAPRVMVRAARVGDTVRIDILDNGPGIAAEDRERIFEPYVTTKKGGDGKPLGTGMGLAIARRYAQHMGGRVGLDAERTETCFYLQLVAWKD